jgi:hypothetical protein
MCCVDVKLFCLALGFITSSNILTINLLIFNLFMPYLTTLSFSEIIYIVHWYDD